MGAPRVDREFSSKYKLGDELGRGAFAAVYRCDRLRDGRTFAVKVMDKHDGRMSISEIRQEVGFMRNLDHPNIVRFEDVIESPRTLYIVSELCEGGELLERLLSRGSYSEAIACKVFAQLVSAVDYLHSRNIVHRDLKPDNILMVSDNDDTIKLSDFGLSGELTRDDGSKIAMTEKCGTPEYAAPEVLDERVEYDERCDWWSVGVILYVILIGKFPFHGGNGKMERDIMAGNLVIDPNVERGLTPHAVDLIRRLLTVDANRRYGYKQIMAHPWMKGAASAQAVPQETFEQLRSFVARRRFRKGINVVRGVYRFATILQRLRLLTNSRTPQAPPLLPSRSPVCVLTGGTGVIGREVARMMADRGYHVIMGCRNSSDGRSISDWVRGSYADAIVESSPLDLTDQKSVFDFVAAFRKRNLPLAVLVHCAGVIDPDTRTTHAGQETTMATNLYGPFLLTHLLQDVLKRSRGESRVVFVSSGTHKRAPQLDFKKLDNPVGNRNEALNAYAQSKLAAMVFAFETSRRFDGKGATVNCVHPGHITSPIGSSLSGGCVTFMRKSPTVAAASIVHVATSHELEGVTGEYFKGKKRAAPSHNALNKNDGQRVWNACAKATDVYTWADKLTFGVARWLDSRGRPTRISRDHRGDESVGTLTEANTTFSGSESASGSDTDYYTADSSDESSSSYY